MNNHNEERYMLYFGRMGVDVSNVSYGREEIAKDKYLQACEEHIVLTDKQKKGLSEEDQQKLITKIKSRKRQNIFDWIGLYLIRQDFIVLKRRFNLIKAIYEYIKRYCLTTRFIKRSNEKQYREYEDWLCMKIFGKKKVNLEIRDSLLDKMETIMVDIMEKTNLEHDQCLALLQTLAMETAEQSINSTQGRQK